MTDSPEQPQETAFDVMQALQVHRIGVYVAPAELMDAMVSDEHREQVGALFALVLSGSVPLVIQLGEKRFAARGMSVPQEVCSMLDVRALARISASIERVINSRPPELISRYWQEFNDAADRLQQPDAPPVEAPTTIEEQAEQAAAMFEQQPHMPGQYL